MEDTDLFLVNRDDTTYKQTADDLMAQLEDTDYLLVNRNDKTYKITGAEFKDSVEPDTGSIVTGATVVASSEYPPSTLTATAAVVINATKDLSYDNWYKDDVAITGTTEQLVYNATSSATYKYEERWVDNAGNEIKPNATVTIKQSEVAKPTVLAPADGAGLGTTITYYPETSAITTVGTSTGGWNSASSDNAYTYRAVTAGTDKFVALADSGQFVYSSDGLAWTTGSTGNAGYWKAVACSSSGRYCAVAATANGQSSGSEVTIKNLISDNGVSWRTPSAPLSISSSYSNIIWSTAHSVFIATVESGGASGIRYSSTGDSNWSNPDTMSGDQVWTGIAENPANGQIVFVAKNAASTGTYPLTMYTYNLSQFYAGTDLPRESWQDVAFGNGVFVAVAGNGSIARSTDGGNWTSVSNVPFAAWASITYGDGKFVAVAEPASEYNYGYSEDGITWNLDIIPGETHFKDITYGLGKFVAVGNITSGGNKIYTSETASPATQTLTLTNDKVYNSADASEVTTIDEAFTAGTVVQGGGSTSPDTAAFSTTTYDGTGSSRSVDTGIDNTGKSLLWVKCRQPGSRTHAIYDTERGAGYRLSTADNYTVSGGVEDVTAFNDDGFTAENTSGFVNGDNESYVAWNFRAAPGFLDIVTYTGDSTPNRRIPHELGTKPGFIITKSLSVTGDWWCYHSGMNSPWTGGNVVNDVSTGNHTGAITLNTITAFQSNYGLYTYMENDAYGVQYLNAEINDSGTEYVAYLFADTPGKIKCGTYTGDGQGYLVVDVGFKPAWVLSRKISGTDDWFIVDTERTNPDLVHRSNLIPNKTNTENNSFYFKFIDNAFHAGSNTDGEEYIYVAIAEDVEAGNFPPTGVLSADADKSGPSITLKDIKGTWSNGMTAVGRTELTQGAPSPDALEFVGSTPAVANGTITTWGNATWTVTDKSDSSTQTESKAITAGQEQKLNVGGDITLSKGTIYDVTVRYDAPDAIGATSDANTFQTDGPIGAYGNFSTTLYTGNSGTQTINTGIDNTENKTLVWLKNRSHDLEHSLWGSDSSWDQYLSSNTTAGLSGSMIENAVVPKSDGFELNVGYGFTNNNSNTYVAWNFRGAPGFFDVVRYEGNDIAGHEIPHALGQKPGMIILKKIDGVVTNWYIYHKELTAFGYLVFTTDLAAYNYDIWNSEPDENVFRVGPFSEVNLKGGQFIAYLFADNPDKGIKCGSYTGTGSSQTIECGFAPGFVMTKKANGDSDWLMMDKTRDAKAVYANATTTEQNAPIVFGATGFTVDGIMTALNENNAEIVYIAIADSINTDTFYNINTKETIRGFEIIAKHGIEPDSTEAKALGFAELTEQPDYAVSGYELQADGRYKPIRSYEGEVVRLTAELAAAQATIDTLENP